MDHTAASPERRASAAQTLAWTALLIAIVALYARGVGSFQPGVYQDDAAYLVLSHSIAFGDQYGLVNGPGPPRPSKYPFVFPLLLAPFAHPPAAAVDAIVPHGDAPEQYLIRATVVPLVATLLNVSLLFWAWPLLSRTSRWWGVGVASLHGLSPLVTGHARMIMSEPVFVTFLLAAILLTEICARRRSRPWWALGLGAAIAAAVFTRTIGITIAVAAVLRLGVPLLSGLRRHAQAAPMTAVVRTLALVALGAAVFVAAAVTSTSVGFRDLGSKAYVDERIAATENTGQSATETFASQVLRVGRGYLLDQVRNVILPFGGGERTHEWARRLGVDGAPAWIGAAIAGLVLIGAWASARRRLFAPTVLLFEVVYFTVIVLWPWEQARYLYPIQPFLQFEFLLGIARIGAIGKRGTSLPFSASAAAAVALALVLCSGWKSLEISDSRHFSRDLSVGTDWLALHTPPRAIVMARYPEAVYLYSGRTTVDLVAAATPADVERQLADSAADYVLVAPRLAWGAAAPAPYGPQELTISAALAGMASRGRAELVFESPPDKVAVYALRTSREGS